MPGPGQGKTIVFQPLIFRSEPLVPGRVTMTMFHQSPISSSNVMWLPAPKVALKTEGFHAWNATVGLDQFLKFLIVEVPNNVPPPPVFRMYRILAHFRGAPGNHSKEGGSSIGSYESEDVACKILVDVTWVMRCQVRGKWSFEVPAAQIGWWSLTPSIYALQGGPC